jgi:hypothetical protein
MTTTDRDFELLKSKIARSLKEILTTEVRTPEGEKVTPCDVHVPYNHIEADDEEADTATALIIYATYCPVEKRHSVRIKFKYDKYGKFQRDTMIYV